MGLAVREALANDGHGEVIAAFSRASYVSVGGHVFALLSVAEVSGPLHARVQSPPRVRCGDRAHVIDGALFIAGTPVGLPSDCWEPGGIPGGVSIAGMLGTVLMHEPELDLGPAERGALEGALMAAWARGGLDEACRAIFGRGCGLTPAGDDVAAGLLVSEALLGAGDEAARMALAAGAPTHSISRAFLSWAARGQSIEPLHRLLAACAADDLSAAQRARADLAGIGHTSGLDLAYGVLIGFRRAEAAGAAARPARRMTSRALAQTTA